MKKFLAVAMVGALLAATMAVDSAEAKKRRNNSGAAFAVGAVVGLALGTAFRPYPAYGYGYGYGYYPRYGYAYPRYGYAYPRYRYVKPRARVVYRGGNAHVRWCLNRYKTYNPRTNTYFVRVGVPAVCRSPYR